jgi:hypothetical protein
VVYALGLLWYVVDRGVPTDRDQALLWTVGGLAAATVATRPARLGRLLLDWVPLAAVLLAYDRTRGLADDLGRPVAVAGPAAVDRFLFGGTVPTEWLQARLSQRGGAAWWEALLTLVYASHFFVPIGVAAGLWLRDREAWARYVRRFVALAVLGLLTYVLVPAAPPWLASKLGELGPVARTTSRGWRFLHLEVAEDVFIHGRNQVNRVAAIPSLHAAYAVLVAATLWPRSRNRVFRLALLAYPLAMGFTLVLCGEHYVFDVVLGALYTAAVLVAMTWAERRLMPSVRADRASEAAGPARSPS